MSAVERLAILVTADGGGAIREFGKVGDAADRELGRAETGAERLGGKMTSAGAVMMGASAVMVAGLWNAGQGAAALEQSVGGSEAVFKENAGVLLEWAKGADKAAGLSEEAALRLTTRLGGALKGLGYDQETAADQSIKLTSIAADLAATYGGTTADAVTALGSAYRGEFDPAEQFNLFLKQSEVDAKAVEMGLAKSTSQVDKYARAQAVTALIMEQSTDAQGQFGRESETTSGKLAIAGASFENLKAEIGAGFTPVMTTAGSVLGLFSSGLSSANEATGGFASQLIGIGSVGIGAVGALSFITGQAIKMKDSFAGLGDIPGKFGAMAERWGASAETAGKLSNAVSGVGQALPVVGVAAVAGIGIWQMYQQSQAEAEQRAKDFISTLNEQTGAITDNTTAKVRSTLEDNNRMDNLQGAGLSVQAYTEALADNSDQMISMGDLMTDWQVNLELGKESNDELVASLRDRGGAMNNLIADLIEAGTLDRGLIDQMYEENGAYRANQEILRARAVDQAISTGKTREAAEAEIDAKAAAEAHTQAIKDQISQLKAMFDPLFGAYDALEKNRDAQEKATSASVAAYLAQIAHTDAVNKWGENSLIAKESGDKLTEATKAMDAANMAAARSALDVDTAMHSLETGMASGAVTMQDAKTKLQDWVTQGYLTQDQAQQVADKLGIVAWTAGTVPRDIFTTVDADTRPALDKLSELHRRMIDVYTFTGTAGKGFTTDGNRAAGGPVAPWSVYEMHDTTDPEILRMNNGRSLVFTGSQGGQVTNLGSAPSTGSGVGGGGAVIQLAYHAGSGGSAGYDDFLRWLRSNQGAVQRALGMN